MLLGFFLGYSCKGLIMLLGVVSWGTVVRGCLCYWGFSCGIVVRGCLCYWGLFPGAQLLGVVYVIGVFPGV